MFSFTPDPMQDYLSEHFRESALFERGFAVFIQQTDIFVQYAMDVLWANETGENRAEICLQIVC